MRFSPETDPHYWDHKVFTTDELYDAMEERDRLKAQLVEAEISRLGREKRISEIKKLKSKRKSLKLTLEAVAARMKISKSTLDRFEKQQRQPDEKMLEKYRLALVGKQS